MRSSYRWSGMSLLALAALLFGLGLSATGAAAQTPPAASTAALMKIPAGQSAQVQVQGFCLDFGKPFPTGAVSPKELGSAPLRAALNYAIQKGYVDSNPEQVEQAIWFLSDGTWHRPDHTLGQEIVDNSKTGSAPSDPSGGQTLFDAIAAGGITATVTFTPKTADHFYGDGTLTIRNTGSSDVQIYLPVGTVFPPSTPGQQRLLTYALQVTQPAATATTAATTTPAATATTAATTTPAATATTVAVATAAPTETAMPVATATALPNLPTTGGGPSDNGLGWLLFVAALLSLGGGIVLLRRSAQSS